MSWPGEKQRHGMSARGISTAQPKFIARGREEVPKARIIILPWEGYMDPMNQLYNDYPELFDGNSPVYLIADPDDTETLYFSVEKFTLEEARRRSE